TSPKALAVRIPANLIFQFKFLIASLVWSAVHWRDIATSAQTERRSGAGPVGACLAVRTHRPLCFLVNGPSQFRRQRVLPGRRNCECRWWPSGRARSGRRGGGG